MRFTCRFISRALAVCAAVMALATIATPKEAGAMTVAVDAQASGLFGGVSGFPYTGLSLPDAYSFGIASGSSQPGEPGYPNFLAPNANGTPLFHSGAFVPQSDMVPGFAPWNMPDGPFGFDPYALFFFGTDLAFTWPAARALFLEIIESLPWHNGGCCPPHIPPVPLPAALPLFSMALLGLGVLGWRRRKAA